MEPKSTSHTSHAEKIYELGEKPPLGVVPENMHPYGNTACLVNATQTGLGAK